MNESYKNATDSLIEQHVNIRNARSFNDLNITDKRTLIVSALMDDYFDQAEMYLESHLDIHSLLIQFFEGSINEYDVGMKLIKRVNEYLTSELSYDIERVYDLTYEMNQEDKKADEELEKQFYKSVGYGDDDQLYKDVVKDLENLEDDE